jgi:hypothetical protein
MDENGRTLTSDELLLKRIRKDLRNKRISTYNTIIPTNIICVFISGGIIKILIKRIIMGIYALLICLRIRLDPIIQNKINLINKCVILL